VAALQLQEKAIMGAMAIPMGIQLLSGLFGGSDSGGGGGGFDLGSFASGIFGGGGGGGGFDVGSVIGGFLGL
jgi:hypothetical protein